MQILSVTLRDFKIHRDRQFTFQPGVNAICGENGAGKTSILEAIAWVLFDHDSGYKKDQLRHQSAKSAEVTVEFISALDGRTYRVQRETAKSRSDRYIIFDPQLNVQIDDINKIEDAQRWLCDHLGLPKGTPLAKLFAEVIGIPQGTFTLDFLKSATERRKVFDPILKVAEYKEAYRASSDLAKYAGTQVQTVEQAIANLSDRLADWEDLQAQHRLQTEKVAQSTNHLASLEQEVQQLQAQRATLQAVAQAIAQLSQQLAGLGTQIQAKQSALGRQGLLVEQASQAQEACSASSAAHRAYLEAEMALAQLTQDRQRRDDLLRQQNQLSQQFNQLQVDQAGIQSRLAQLALAEAQLLALQPAVVEQMKLEAQQQEQQKELQLVQQQRQVQARLQEQQKQLQAQQPLLTHEIERLTGLAGAIAQLPNLEAQLQQLQTQLGQVSASQRFSQLLARLSENSHQQVQQHRHRVTEIVQQIEAIANAPKALRPLLDQASEALSCGVELHQQDLQALQAALAELQTQSDEAQLRQQLRTIQAELKQAQRQSLAYEALPAQQEQLQQVERGLQDLAEQLTALQLSLASQATLEQELAAVDEALRTLENPRTQSQMLKQQLAEGDGLGQRQAQLTAQQAEIEAAIALLAQQLAPYAELDHQVQRQERAKQQHSQGYRLYLQNEKEAAALGDRQQQLGQLQIALERLQTEQTDVQSRCDQASADHDPAALADLERRYSSAKQQYDQLAGALPGQRQELTRLGQALEQRQLWAAQRSEQQATLARKQQLQQFIADARRIYNQSGPRITQFYLNEIVREGDRLFRELMNRQSVALNWTEDYEIQIQEGSTWRGFKTLSGGEQMAAALAIRLALLKVLAELDVAFFDEPTTNMDRPRRQQLAEALANLKTFRQLFVISHDDTFEAVTDSIIRVERQPA